MGNIVKSMMLDGNMQKNYQSTPCPKTHRNSRQSDQQKNGIVAKAWFTIRISAGIKKKSVLNVVRRIRKQPNVAVTVKLSFEMAGHLEAHIT